MSPELVFLRLWSGVVKDWREMFCSSSYETRENSFHWNISSLTLTCITRSKMKLRGRPNTVNISPRLSSIHRINFFFSQPLSSILMILSENMLRWWTRFKISHTNITIYHGLIGENWLLMVRATLLYFTRHHSSSLHSHYYNASSQQFYLFVLCTQFIIAHLNKPGLLTCLDCCWVIALREWIM